MWVQIGKRVTNLPGLLSPRPGKRRIDNGCNRSVRLRNISINRRRLSCFTQRTELRGGGHSKAFSCETKKITTALKLQIILLSLLVTYAAALFCLPAKNAYAVETETTIIDGVTYEYAAAENYGNPLPSGTLLIIGISTKDSSVVVPEEIAGRYVSGICVSGKAGSYSGEGFFSANIISLDVSNCSKLIELSVQSTNVASLDISNCSALKYLQVRFNNLTSLDVSKNTALTLLDCAFNNLTSLNVSKNTALMSLDCHQNNLTSLDVSKNTALWQLECSENNLTSLDISMLENLEALGCFNNELSSLDISACKKLDILNCSNNCISDTSKLLAWLADHPRPSEGEYDDNKVLPQKVSGDSGNAGNTGNSGNAGNAGNSGDNTSGSADNNNTPATVTGTWKHNSKGWWYAYSNGTYAKGMKKIGNATYYFDSKGWMKTGWQHATGNSDWYYFSKSGAMKTGWLKSGGKWYYLNPSDGKMKTGFYNVGKTRYYSNGSGVMKTGWQKISNSWYYFASSGAMKTGWAKVSGKWYYLNSEGKMQTGKQVISGKTYFLNSSGAMRTGWIKDGSAWRYANKSGAMQTSKWIGNYYVDANGTMLTNQWVKTNGKEYYVNKSGKWTGAKR